MCKVLRFNVVLTNSARNSPPIQSFMEANQLFPSWILHLGLKSARTHRIQAQLTVDESSYFGSVVNFEEITLLSLIGRTVVRSPGYYQVVWRLRLDSQYDLGTTSFGYGVTELPKREFGKPDTAQLYSYQPA